MKDSLKKIAQKIETSKEKILTEEATKTAFIMPFIAALGYDVFDPSEVIPEFVADIGTKQGEKVDYAIVIESKPRILIECKPCHSELNITNESQLLRYFNTTSSAKFAILTNGIIYRFYTDLEKPNVMDLTYFLEINLSDFDHMDIKELEKFSKKSFNIDDIIKTADILKMLNATQTIITEEINSPSEEFVRLVFKKISSGAIFTASAKEKLTPIVKNAFDSIINEMVRANLESALTSTEDKTKEISQSIAEVKITDHKNDILTTEEERQGFHILQAICASVASVEKICMRDAKTYCAILFEDNNRKPISRLHFNGTQKRVSLFDSDTEEIIPITKIEDLYSLSDRILLTLKKYL